jgi:hypothetical protein
VPFPVPARASPGAVTPASTAGPTVWAAVLFKTKGIGWLMFGRP